MKKDLKKKIIEEAEGCANAAGGVFAQTSRALGVHPYSLVVMVAAAIDKEKNKLNVDGATTLRLTKSNDIDDERAEHIMAKTLAKAMTKNERLRRILEDAVMEVNTK